MDLDGIDILDHQFKMVKGMSLITNYTLLIRDRAEITKFTTLQSIAIDGTHFGDSGNHFDQPFGQEIKKLMGQHALGVYKHVLDFIVRTVEWPRKEFEFVDRAGHPCKLRQYSTQKPRNNQGANSTTWIRSMEEETERMQERKKYEKIAMPEIYHKIALSITTHQ